MDPCAARLVLRVLGRARGEVLRGPAAPAPVGRPPVSPSIVRSALRERLVAHAARRGLGAVALRFRRAYVYVDVDGRPLLRLRWTGELARWELARFAGRGWIRAAGPHGDFHAAPEDALDAVAVGA